MQYRKDGAEVLAEALDSIFNPLVAQVYAHGGFIAAFAGDAFTVVFPLTNDDALLHALHVAFLIRDFFGRHGLIQTKYGQFEMGCKGGLSIGQVEWGILGSGIRHTHFFRGQAIDACALAEQCAETGDIILDKRLALHIPAQLEACPGQPYFKLAALPDLPLPPGLSVSSPPLTRDALTPFVLDAVIDMTATGVSAEFRKVASVFISFDEPQDHTELNQFVAAALDNLGAISSKLGGYIQAQIYYEQALHIFREIGDRQDENIVLARLGLLHHYLGNEIAYEYCQQALQIACDLGDRSTQGYALTNLGHILAGYGHWPAHGLQSKGAISDAARSSRLAEAAAVYKQALAIRRELNQHNPAMENLAALAYVFLAQGDAPAAITCIQEILDYVESNPLTGADHPFQVYLTCYHSLCASHDPRAANILTTAYNLLQERADKIGDPELRRSFLENVAAHREIVQEWQNLAHS